jgi:Fic family protein
MIRYKLNSTSKIRLLLIQLEAVNLVFNNLKSSPEIEEGFRRKALLKSAVFSARIEGFTDTVIIPKLESQNLLIAYKLIHGARAPKKLTLSFLRTMHKTTMKNILGGAGQWRSEPWAIYDAAGRVIHLATPHYQLPGLMPEFVNWVNKLDEPVGTRAALSQFVVEKIHPFADGNGRVGRLISAFILEKGGFGFRGLAPFEEFIDNHREEYYAALEPSTNAGQFVEFFLEAIVEQAKEIVERLGQTNQGKSEDKLLPRRRELLEIIREHPHCSFDFVARRFTAVNPKTLHYDLLQLMRVGLVRKLGVSRGSVYTTNGTGV